MTSEAMRWAVVLVAGLVTAWAKGATFTATVATNGSGDYTTIQAAVDAYEDSGDYNYDITVLDSATYVENLSLYTSASAAENTIKAADGEHPTIDGSGGDFTLSKTASGGTYRFLECDLIAGSKGVLNTNRGMTVELEGCVVTYGNVPAFYTFGRNSSFTDCTFLGGAGGTAIYGPDPNEYSGGWNSAATFTRCTIIGAAKGVELNYIWWSESGFTMEKCLFWGNGTAVEAKGLWGNDTTITLTNCDFYGNTVDMDESDADGVINDAGTTYVDPKLDVEKMTYSLAGMSFGDTNNWTFLGIPKGVVIVIK